MNDFTDFENSNGLNREVRIDNLLFDDGTFLKCETVRYGGLGKIYIGTLYENDTETKQVSTGVKIAAKSFHDRLMLDTDARTSFLQEISVWTQVSECPFVIPVFCFKKAKGVPYILTLAVEAEDGVVSVRDLINTKHEGISTQQVFKVALAVALAMSASEKIIPELVHGDIKPDNILLMNSVPYLSDFGLATLVTQELANGKIKGTHHYLAPEVLSQKRQFKSADIYAYGCTLYECLNLKLPSESLILPENKDDPMRTYLGKLAIKCLDEQPKNRPKDFDYIAHQLIEHGKQWVPKDLTRLLTFQIIKQLSSVVASPKMRTLQIIDLLKIKDIEGALSVLHRLPEQDWDMEMMKVAGSTYSLAGDDEKAIEYFHRCLDNKPDQNIQIGCLSEMGLSLRRLGKLNEALELYRQLLKIVDDKRLFQVMSNYIGTLCLAGRDIEAVAQANWLVNKFPQKAQAHLLLGQVRKASGDYKAAIFSLKHSIELDFNESLAHMELAEIYLFELGDPQSALNILTNVLSLGEPSEILLVRLLTASALTKNRENIALLKQSMEKLPKASIEKIYAALEKDLKMFYEKIVSKQNESHTDLTEVERLALNEKYKSFIVDKIVKMKNDSAFPMMAYQALVPGKIYVIDYYDVEDIDYPNRFAESLFELQQKHITQFGDLLLRNTMLTFIRCENCSFSILTNRTTTENIECAVCSQKGPIKEIESTELKSLIALCEKKASLTRTIIGGQFATVALWEFDPSDAQKIIKICHKYEWTEITGKSRSIIFGFLMMHYGINPKTDECLLFRRIVPEGETIYDGRPWTTQQLLLELGKAFGRIHSLSLLEDYDRLKMIENPFALQIESLLKEYGDYPKDPEKLAMLIEARTGNGEIEKAQKLVVYSQQIVNSNHPQLEVARGFFMLRTGNLKTAEELLKRAKNLLPMDVCVRAHLVELWSQTGDKVREIEELNQLKVLSIGLD